MKLANVMRSSFQSLVKRRRLSNANASNLRKCGWLPRRACGLSDRRRLSEERSAMSPSAPAARKTPPRNLWVIDLAPRAESIQREVIEGLSQPQKTVAPQAVLRPSRRRVVQPHLRDAQLLSDTHREQHSAGARSRNRGCGRHRVIHHRVRCGGNEQDPTLAAEPAAPRSMPRSTSPKNSFYAPAPCWRRIIRGFRCSR